MVYLDKHSPCIFGGGGHSFHWSLLLHHLWILLVNASSAIWPPHLSFCNEINQIFFIFYQRIPLDFLQGDRFREAADSYIRPLLTKVCTNPLWYNVLPILQASKSKCDFILFPFQGVPSLFSDLSSLYNHPGKVSLIT